MSVLSRVVLCDWPCTKVYILGSCLAYRVSNSLSSSSSGTGLESPAFYCAVDYVFCKLSWLRLIRQNLKLFNFFMSFARPSYCISSLKLFFKNCFGSGELRVFLMRPWQWLTRLPGLPDLSRRLRPLLEAKPVTLCGLPVSNCPNGFFYRMLAISPLPITLMTFYFWFPFLSRMRITLFYGGGYN